MKKNHYTKEDCTKEAEEFKKEVLDIPFEKERILNSDISIDLKAMLAFKKLKSQISGPLVETLIKEFLGAKKIKSSKDRGDLLTKYGTYDEVKTGAFNAKGKTNIPQCRPYQELDYYLIYKYDPISKKTYIFYIPALKVKEICSTINSNSHTTKKRGKNKRAEKSIQISLNKNHEVPYAIFCEFQKYSFDSLESLKKHQEDEYNRNHRNNV